MPYVLTCAFCGQPFSTQDKRRRFCSQSCAAKHSNQGRARSLESRRRTSEAVRKSLDLDPAPAAFERPKTERKPRTRTAPLNPKGTAHRYGPYRHKGHGYLYYTDVYPDGRRRKVQAHRDARLLGGREASQDEVVHHKDGDKHNNDRDNLEVQPREGHTRAHNKKRGRAMVRLCCPWCRDLFSRRRGRSHLVPSRPGDGTFCSRSCRASFYRSELSATEKQKRLID